MERDHIETVRMSFEAIGRGDVEALLALYDPVIDFLPLTGTRVETGGYHGHEGVREYFEEVAPIWAEVRPYAIDFRVVGDAVVVLGGCRVRGRESGAESDDAMAWVIRVRDGKIVSHRGFAEHAEALESVGLGD
jgi:uncharacterized protein